MKQKIIDFIIRHYAETKFYPTYDEIAEHVGICKNTVYTHMKSLEKAGVIVKKDEYAKRYRLINMDYIQRHRRKEKLYS